MMAGPLAVCVLRCHGTRHILAACLQKTAGEQSAWQAELAASPCGKAWQCNQGPVYTPVRIIHWSDKPCPLCRWMCGRWESF